MEDGVDMEEEKADVDPDPDEEDMAGVRLDNKRERNWRMVFEDNDGGVDGDKALLYDKNLGCLHEQEESAY